MNAFQVAAVTARNTHRGRASCPEKFLREQQENQKLSVLIITTCQQHVV